MNVTVTENRLLVVTDVTKAAIESGLTDLTARDAQGNEVYKLQVNTEGTGRISNNSATINTFVEDKAAIAITLPMGTTVDDVKKQYGKALVNLDKYSVVIASAAEATAEEINSIFAQ